MKRTLTSLVTVAVILSLTACSSTKMPSVEAPQVTAIGNQKLTSTFKREGIKIEFGCSTIGSWTSGCKTTEPTAIEITAYAAVGGNTAALEEDAYKVATLMARKRYIDFINNQTTSSEWTKIVAKTIEKANDNVKQRINNGEVSVSEDDAKEFNKDSNVAIRDNANQVIRTTTTIINSTASGKMKGFYPVAGSARPVGDGKRVQITLRWDTQSEIAANFFLKKSITR